MNLGLLAIILALGAAIWLLIRMVNENASGGASRNDVIFKGVAFLVLIAVMFAAKWWPLAFMTMIAAGGVMGIELWRARAMQLDNQNQMPSAQTRAAMKAEEAALVLGVAVDASADEIRTAHKKLIAQLHPDRGGTDYLAAQINDARAVLMSKIERHDMAHSSDEKSEK